MRGLFNKHFWKFLVGFLAIMAVGFFALVWSNIYHNGQNYDESKGEKYLRDLKRAYDEDTYGGKTPEETLQLFIDALKKGDIELATKYMIIEEQEKMLSDLKEAKNAGRLNQVVQNISLAKLSSKDDNNATFSVVNNNNVLQYQASFVKAPNDIWKILDL